MRVCIHHLVCVRIDMDVTSAPQFDDPLAFVNMPAYKTEVIVWGYLSLAERFVLYMLCNFFVEGSCRFKNQDKATIFSDITTDNIKSIHINMRLILGSMCHEAYKYHTKHFSSPGMDKYELVIKNLKRRSIPELSFDSSSSDGDDSESSSSSSSPSESKETSSPWMVVPGHVLQDELDALASQFSPNTDLNFGDHMVLSCNLGLTQWLVGAGMTMNQSSMNYAASAGQCDTVEFLFLHCKLALNEEVFSYAARGGHIKMLEWLVKYKCPMSTAAGEAAAESGHYNVLHWLCAQKLRHRTIDFANVIIGAAVSDDVSIAEWAYDMWCLHVNAADIMRTNPLTPLAVLRAAQFGSVNVMKWLFSKKCPFNLNLVCGFAGYYGHSRVLDCITEHEYPISSYAYYGAARAGHISMLYLLIRVHRVPLDTMVPAYAAVEGRSGVLAWLVYDQKCPIDDNSFIQAIIGCKLHTIKFLVNLHLSGDGHENVISQPGHEYMTYAIGTGDLRVVECIYAYTLPTINHEEYAMTFCQLAITMGCRDILEWLLFHDRVRYINNIDGRKLFTFAITCKSRLRDHKGLTLIKWMYHQKDIERDDAYIVVDAMDAGNRDIADYLLGVCGHPLIMRKPSKVISSSSLTASTAAISKIMFGHPVSSSSSPRFGSGTQNKKKKRRLRTLHDSPENSDTNQQQ